MCAFDPHGVLSVVLAFTLSFIQCDIYRVLLLNFSAGCSSAPGHQQPVPIPPFATINHRLLILFSFCLTSHSLSPYYSLARDEAATLTWRRDVGVRAIAAVLGQGASGRATLDGSSCNKAAFGVSNAAAPSLSHHPFAQVEELGIEHAATSITPSIFSSEVSESKDSFILLPAVARSQL